MKLITQRQAIKMLRDHGLSIARSKEAVKSLHKVKDGERKKVLVADVIRKAGFVTTPIEAFPSGKNLGGQLTAKNLEGLI
ncbi:MAG: hypothetical protein KF855_03175 [Acidobacteria bacterium]|nr:hypothetical protein [Acidobacteriota bacterium]